MNDHCLGAGTGDECDAILSGSVPSPNFFDFGIKAGCGGGGALLQPIIAARTQPTVATSRCRRFMEVNLRG